MLQSCSKIHYPVIPGINGGGGSSFNRQALWEDDDVDIQGNQSQNVAGHLDVTNVVGNWPGPGTGPPEGQIVKWHPWWALNDTTLTVAAWSENVQVGETWKSEIRFRVIYWVKNDQNYEQWMGPIEPISDMNASLTYPTVTSYLSIPFQDGPFSADLIVYIAYEKRLLGETEKRICYRVYKAIGFENKDFSFAEEVGETPVPVVFTGQYTLKHPDIVFYNYPGDYFNQGCETAFIAFEYETAEAYGLVGMDLGNINCPLISFIPKVGIGEIQTKPEYPRIDAGLDYIYPTPEPPPFHGKVGRSVVTCAYHIRKFDPGNPQIPTDFDWTYVAFNLSDYPTITLLSVTEPPNDENTWDVFPYVDTDPIEVPYAKGSPKTYSHFVVTESQPGGVDYFQVMYTNTSMLTTVNQTHEAFGLDNKFSGPASIVMYPAQEYEEFVPKPDLKPDFDIYFFSNHEIDGAFRYYSKRFYFVNEIDTDLLPYDLLPRRISNLAYTPPGQLPIYYYLIPKAPVGAAFNWKSELVVYKYWAQNGQHHIWGNYEYELPYYPPPPNQPPVASFEYNPHQGPAPLTVAFDNYSYDPDPYGWIVRIECDWNGVPEIIEDNPVLFHHTFIEPGEYICTLTVVDNYEEKSSPWTGMVYVE